MYAILHLVSERTVNRVADNGFFKTSFRGFRKTDVLEYIDTLNAAHCEEVAAMQGQLSALQTEHDALQKAHTALENEAVALREKEKELSFAHDELTTAKNQVAFLTEQTNSQREKLAALQETAGRVNALRTETAVQKQQLAEQNERLDFYEKMFADSKDAASYVRRTVKTQLSQERQRTEEALSATERMAAQLTEQLETLRRETAAIRQRTAAGAAADEKQLDAWLQQLENRPPQADDAHFFRCAADEP